MFNKKVNARLKANDLAIQQLGNKAAIQGTQIRDLSRELDTLRDVVAEYLRSPSDTTIGISHVDASNVKIDHSMREVVQALADNARLGSVPEQGSEIVVINPE